MDDQALARVHQLEIEALSLYRARQLDAAEGVIANAIQLVEATCGMDSPRLVWLLRLLEKVVRPPFGSRGDRQVPYILRALEIARTHGSDETTLSGIYGQAGGALRAAGRLSEARAMHESALEMAYRGGRSAAITFQLGALASVVATISTEESIPLWEELVQLEAAEEAESMTHVVALARLGQCLVAVGRKPEGAPWLEQAVRILKNRTPTHRWVLELQGLIDEVGSEIK